MTRLPLAESRRLLVTESRSSEYMEEEGKVKDGEVQVEVKGEVEENQGQPHMDGMWMKVKDSRTT